MAPDISPRRMRRACFFDASFDSWHGRAFYMTKKMADVLAELLSRRGYARVQATANYAEAWREAAGEMLARYTRAGTVRRGVLEVIVANSTLVQEITFQKQDILTRLAGLVPDEPINNLRLRVGPIE
jgi:predicted nucleic acid-binding Zn ribbon protein